MNIIFDLDGVLIDSSHRHHLIPTSPDGDWDAYEDAADGDRLIMAGVAIMDGLSRRDHTIHFVTSRSEEGARHGVLMLSDFLGTGTHYMHVRADGCKLTGVELKRKLLRDIIDSVGDVHLAFEYDPNAAVMYREYGVPTFLGRLL